MRGGWAVASSFELGGRSKYEDEELRLRRSEEHSLPTFGGLPSAAVGDRLCKTKEMTEAILISSDLCMICGDTMV